MEVARQYQRLVLGNGVADVLDELGYLQLPLALEQAQVNADEVHAALDGPVQKTAVREAEDRGVDVVPADEGQGAEDGVAMMTVLIDRVATIGMVSPDGVCQILKLSLGWPGRKLFLMPLVGADHFLQKDDGRTTLAQLFANLAKYQPFRPYRETLV